MVYALASLVLVAAVPGLGSVPSDPQHIAGGESVNPCGWPSVVVMRGNGYLCTGNLIHPEIVATAAHCIEVMEPETEVEFGDTANSAHEKVGVEYCMGSPDFVSNGDGTIPFDVVQHDWGFCKLEQPVTDVTPIPPIFGCEVDLLVPGASITRVGYGRESLTNSQFFKRSVDVQINDIPFTGAHGWPTQLSEGGNGAGTCPGDSGGPAFIRIPAAQGGEDAWRMIAIQSTQPLEDGNGDPIECGDAANNTAVIAQGVAWIEQQSGIDITPCFDAATNTWEPTFGCQGFPIGPDVGGGTWAMGCDAGELSGFSEACGLGLPDFNPDEAPPLITIVDPPGPVDEDWVGDPVIVHVLAEATDGTGWGIERVELAIIDAATDMELARFPDVQEAYEWEPEFPQGRFFIQAIGYDNAGHEAQTDMLEIRIGVEADESTGAGESGEPGSSSGNDTGPTSGIDPTGDATTGDASDDEGDGTGGAMPGVDRGGDDGCGCRSADPPAGWLALGLLVLGLRRRR
jgi:MYXO-CTERM domain-containing protein